MNGRNFRLHSLPNDAFGYARGCSSWRDGHCDHLCRADFPSSRKAKAPARAATPNRRGADPVPQPINTKRSVAIIAGLVILSWLAAIADFADRHWISGLELSEAPLGPQNARIDLQPIPVWKTRKSGSS